MASGAVSIGSFDGRGPESRESERLHVTGAGTESVAVRSAPSVQLHVSSTVTLALGLIGFKAIIDFGYRALVAPSFQYQGFRDQPGILSLGVSWLFFLALLPLMVRVLRSETLASQITTLLIAISLVPTTTLVGFDPRYNGWYVLLLFAYWLLFLLACVYLPAIRPFRRPFISEAPHLIGLIALATTIVVLSWRFTGFRLHFGLFDIYSLRAEAREFRAPTLVGYLATMADNILPVLLAYYLRRRWIFVSVMVIAVIMLNFGISATKQVAFLLVFAVASVLVTEPARVNRKIFSALAAIIAIALAEKQLTGTVFIATVSIYRVMFLPAHLHWFHYEFFQNNELLYLTQSALRFFFDSPYRENIQFLMGDFFIGDFSARANNGMFSDAYMNFGTAGIFFYPVLTVLILKMVEGAAEGLSSSVRFVLLMSISFVVVGIPLPTAMVTSGIGALILLLSTLPRKDGGIPSRTMSG
jgi:hypothetical protein